MDDLAKIAALTEPLEALWRLSPPGPDNLLYHPDFTALGQLCDRLYGGGKPMFALSNALRSLGLPCTRRVGDVGSDLGPAHAASALHMAYQRKTIVRRHLCPLNLAAELPCLSFGSNRVGTFSVDELSSLMGAHRLARHYPRSVTDVRQLAQFQWLVVEEVIVPDPRPDARAVPLLFSDLSRDLGEIYPHHGKYPAAVERALFFLLLAPWEDWSTMPEVDWRGFRIPWIYSLDEDLFVSPHQPPNADSLDWETRCGTDGFGDVAEWEAPLEYRLADEANEGLEGFDDALWLWLETARSGPLFETPVAHFMVRAFLSEGMDEIMAHMTAMEAALGLEMDHRKALRPVGAPHPNLSATKRLAARIGALLDDSLAVKQYKALFDLRSVYVHGRGGLLPVSTTTRVSARRLARRIVHALVLKAGGPAQSREAVLMDLMNSGLTYL